MSVDKDRSLRAAAAAREVEATKGLIAECAARLGSNRHDASLALRALRSLPETFAELERGELSMYMLRQRLDSGGAYVPQQQQRDRRFTTIREMAERGCLTEEIAASVGLGVQRVRGLLRRAGIAYASHNKPRINTRELFEQTSHGLAGLAAGLDAAGPASSLDPEVARELAASIGESLRSLNGLLKQLKEHARGHG